MEASAVWSLVDGAMSWPAGAVGLLAVAIAAALLLLVTWRRRAVPSLENDSTFGDDDATGFRSSRFAARVCCACSQPMLLESDGRWRCAGYPVCRN